MDISVIVPTKDRKDELAKFVDSLCRQTSLPDELVVVDASENNDTKYMLEQISDQLPFDVVYERTHPGAARQRNIGFSLSHGKRIFFFDDDVVLDPKFIQVIYETFLKFDGQKIGGITGRITNISSEKNLIDNLFKKLFFLSGQGKGRLKPSGFPELRTDDKLSFVEILSGGTTAYIRDAFSRYSFDENLTGYSYMEDIDLSYRASKEFKLLYQPEATCKHFATTYKTANSRELRAMLARHHLYLFRKNLPKDLLHIFAFVMSLIGLLLYNGILAKDIKACIGIAEGLITPLSLSHSVKKERYS